MNNSRLIQVFQAFKKSELDLFERFLKNDFAQNQQSEKLISLFELIKKHYPNFENSSLSKENVYQSLFEGKEWVPGKLDKLLTHLLKLVYQFISIHFYKDHISSDLIVSWFLQRRNLKPILERELKKWNKKLESTPFNSEILYEKFLFKEILVESQSNNFNPKEKLELPNLIQSLDEYYIFTKLKYVCQLLAINTFIYPVEIKDSLKSFEHLDHLVQLPHLQTPIIKVYYQAYKMLTSAEDQRTDNFMNFKSLLNKYDYQLSIDHQKTLHGLIRSFAIMQYHSGQQQYLKNVFEIYCDHLNRGFLYYKNKIIPQSFRNLVTFGLRLEEYEWVHQFILDHKEKIHSAESPELIFNFNLALYHFHVKEYDKALDLLPENFEDSYYKIGVKRLEIIIYFETGSRMLDSKIDAFKIFVYRIPTSKITQKQKDANNNFIHLLKQIRHPKTEFSTSRIEKLEEKIKSMDLIAEKDWLLNILQRLNNHSS